MQRKPLGAFRLLLLILGTASVLVIWGLSSGAKSAMADEGPPATPSPRSSLLGAVGGVADHVASTAAHQVAAVESAVSAAAVPVGAALPALVHPVSAPVAGAVTAAVQSIPAPVTKVLRALAAIADTAVGSVPVGSVGVAAVEPIKSLTSPITAAVAGIAGSVTGTVSTLLAPPSPGPTAGGVPVDASPVVTPAVPVPVWAFGSPDSVRRWAPTSFQDSGWEFPTAPGGADRSVLSPLTGPLRPAGQPPLWQDSAVQAGAVSGSGRSVGGSSGPTPSDLSRGLGISPAVTGVRAPQAGDALPQAPSYDNDSTPD